MRSFSYDGSGNISADTRGSTAYSYHYNNRNRLDELTKAPAPRQRITRKT